MKIYKEIFQLLYMNSRDVMVMCYIITFYLHIFVYLTISCLGVKIKNEMNKFLEQKSKV